MNITSSRKRKSFYFHDESSLDINKLKTLFLRDSNSFNKSEKFFIKDSYLKYGKKGIKKIAFDNQILPFAAHILSDLGCDKSYWDSIHQKYVERNIEIKSIVENLFYEFNKSECESPTLTENFAVVLASKSCIGCFCSGDVDISADIKEINKITKCLNSIGFYSKEQPKKIGEYSGQSMQFFNKTELSGKGFWINIVWVPVTRAFLIQGKYQERLKRDRLNASNIFNSNIRILDYTSLLYFCCLHSSAGHYFTLTPGIRLYVDIDRLVRNTNINWNDIVSWEKEDNAGMRISMSLYLSKKLLNTPIPDSIISRITLNKRFKTLAKYLIDVKSSKIQNKSSKIRRLYVELCSDDKFIVFNFFRRFFITIYSKIQS